MQNKEMVVAGKQPVQVGGDDEKQKQRVKRFLAKYPTTLDSMVNELVPGRRIFWNKNIQTPASLYDKDDEEDDDSSLMVHDKIKFAFNTVYGERLDGGLIQFWSPEVFMGGVFLSTSDQPFALEDPFDDPFVTQYRVYSHNCKHKINDLATATATTTSSTNNGWFVMINEGPHITAFLTGFPDVVSKLKKDSNPLVDKALECGFNSLILLPVFSLKTPLTCVGVIECCMKSRSGLFDVLDHLKISIDDVRLTVSPHHVQRCLPYEPLNHAKDEIEEALKMVCEAHQLPLAQVWVDHDAVKHVCSLPSSSLEKEDDPSSNDRHQPTIMYVERLCRYRGVGYDYDNIMGLNYYRAILKYEKACDILPLKTKDDKGLVLDTLKTQEPMFCKNVSTLRHKGLLGRLCRDTKSSCLAICLRSSHTGKYVDYAFEFLWPPRTLNHPFIFLDSLLLTLKKCLPSFKLPSGAQLGDELRVQHVAYDPTTTVSEMDSFEIQNGNRLFKYLEEKGKSESKLAKRNLSDLYPGERQFWWVSVAPSDYSHCDNILAAEYRGKRGTAILKHSITIAAVKENVEKLFNLEPGTYMMEYQHEGGKVVLNIDEDLAACVKLWKRSQRRRYRKFHFKLFVIPIGGNA